MRAAVCQAYACEDAFRFLMEVQKVLVVKRKFPKANLAKRAVSAKQLQ
jgi:hypothetical protein